MFSIPSTLRLRQSLLSIQSLTATGVCVLVAILSYGSQYLLCRTSPALTPDSPSSRELWIFNLLVLSIWLSYYRCLTIDAAYEPHERALPRGALAPASATSSFENPYTDGKHDTHDLTDSIGTTHHNGPAPVPSHNTRHCLKCALPKPPRAHHCKTCRCCIPKMDHHCLWIGQCVGYKNFPPFLRFVSYCSAALSFNGLFLIRAWMEIWRRREENGYGGPGLGQLVALVMLGLGNAVVWFALVTLWVRTIYGWGLNRTAVEGWEGERHRALVRRSLVGERRGFLALPGGGREVLYKRVEFPYDGGIWRNLCLGMGSGNVLMWVLPWAGGLGLETEGERDRVAERDRVVGGEWDEWPPMDPEKMGRWGAGAERNPPARMAWEDGEGEWEEGVRKRVRQDAERKGGFGAEEDAWTNWEGERLDDYGVDEDTENYHNQQQRHHHYSTNLQDQAAADDDDDIPLAELLRRRAAMAPDPTPPIPGPAPRPVHHAHHHD